MMPNIPLPLLMAMLQSGGLNSGSMPWSVNWHSFFPWMPKPKTPLEQGMEAASEALEQLSAPFLQANAQWMESLSQLAQSGEATPSPFTGGGKEFSSEFFNSVSQEAYNQSTGFWQGLQAVMASDYVRPENHHHALWQRGSATLYDYAPKARESVAVFCIPSLINDATILDLYPERSLLHYLRAQGMRPVLLDWGTPSADESDFTPADYIQAYALDALQALRESHEGPIVLLGYCMGGIFATAMAQLAPFLADGLILLATPWDFASEDTPRVLLHPPTQMLLRQWFAAQNPVPPHVIQGVFHLIDPWRAVRKYQRYPDLSEAEKQHFLAVEDWANHGVPLVRGVAEECFVDWPQGNILARHQWKVGRRWIEPAAIQCPTLAVVAGRDSIVPPGCAMPLAKQLKRCQLIAPDTGHVSMIVGSRAPELVWKPLVEWVRARFC